jgi:hypothetical protein
MLAQKRTKRPIGQILLDGGFLSQRDLAAALEEQKHTNELLGQVLVRMGVLDPTDIKAVLLVQENLDHTENAVKTAAGVRQMLGDLLLQAGQITPGQLDQAIHEQKKSGEKLGAVLMRLGLLTEQQLHNVLDFQRNQEVVKSYVSPLRLGELLVYAGHISRGQLDDALRKQAVSRKKLGEVLIEEGYAQPNQIKHGIRLQQMLQTSVLVAILSLGSMTACGSGGGGGAGAAVPSSTTNTTSVTPNVDQQQAPANCLTVTDDEYGLLKPNFFYSTNNDAFWSIQADIGENVWDLNFRTVIRIDIQKSGANSLPSIGGKTFSIEDQTQYEKFPGAFLVLNGEKSVLKKVEQGTISFTPDSTLSGDVNGTFDVILTDYDSTTLPAPQYHLKGTFSFKIGTFGPASSVPAQG